MKKLLILLIILCMTNFAAAYPYLQGTIDRGGEIIPWSQIDPQLPIPDVAPSDLIFIEFWEPVEGGFGGFDTFTLIFSNGEFNDIWPEDPGAWNFIPFGAQADQYNDGPGGAPSGFEIVMGGMGSPDPDGLLWTLVFHVPDYKQASDWIEVEHILGAWQGQYTSRGIPARVSRDT